MDINTRLPGDCKYQAVYKAQTAVVYAQSEMSARSRACKHFGCKPQRKAEIKITLIEGLCR